MKPVQIKAALILTGRSQIDIANDLGVHALWWQAVLLPSSGKIR